MVPLTLSERGTIELRLLAISRVLDDMKQHRCWDLRLEHDLSRERALLIAQLADN